MIKVSFGDLPSPVPALVVCISHCHLCRSPCVSLVAVACCMAAMRCCTMSSDFEMSVSWGKENFFITRKYCLSRGERRSSAIPDQLLVFIKSLALLIVWL